MTTVDGWRAPGLPVPPSEELTDAIAAIRSAYDMLLGVSPEHLCDDDVVRLLDAGVECQARATAVVVAAAGEADRRSLGDASGARTTGSWWAHRSRLTPASAGRTVSTARLLTDDLHAPVRDALAAGSIHADQASVIARAVEAIPTHADQLPADPEPPGVLKARARDHLLGEAARLDAAALHVLGRRILQVVAPAICEAAEAKALEDEEAEAARKVKLRLREDGHGSIHGRFTIPQAAGEALRKQLLALADPTRADISASGVGDDPSEGIGDRPRPLHVRLGWALIEWVERYPAGALPTTGGVGATAVVTMSLETRGAAWVPHPWTPEPASAPARHGGSRARPASSPWSSAAGPSRWTWVGRSASTRRPSGSRWESATVAARPRGAGCRRPRATPITTARGRLVAARTPSRADSSAIDITA